MNAARDLITVFRWTFNVQMKFTVENDSYRYFSASNILTDTLTFVFYIFLRFSKTADVAIFIRIFRNLSRKTA